MSKLESEVSSQESEVRSQKSGIRSQKSEVRSQNNPMNEFRGIIHPPFGFSSRSWGKPPRPLRVRQSPTAGNPPAVLDSPRCFTSRTGVKLALLEYSIRQTSRHSDSWLLAPEFFGKK
ncbi:MAG: hypothetical protein PUP93_11440 [Rhizonema sp. NSF051]|nr:hypothetical protein [Rhizonema sp. NSF051]